MLNTTTEDCFGRFENEGLNILSCQIWMVFFRLSWLLAYFIILKSSESLVRRAALCASLLEMFRVSRIHRAPARQGNSLCRLSQVAQIKTVQGLLMHIYMSVYPLI